MIDLTDEQARKVLDAAGWNFHFGEWFHDLAELIPVGSDDFGGRYKDEALADPITTVALQEGLIERGYQVRAVKMPDGEIIFEVHNMRARGPTCLVCPETTRTLNEAVIAAWLALEVSDEQEASQNLQAS